MRLQINADDIVMAMTLDDPEYPNEYLDKETGEVVSPRMRAWEKMDAERSAGEDEGDDGYDEDDEDEYDPARYLAIPQIPPHVAFEFMEDFVDDLGNTAVARRLEDAIRGRHPFRQFKDAIAAYPDLETAWFSYQETRQVEFARAWLDDNDIDADLVLRRDTPL